MDAESIPTGRDLEQSAAALRSEAAKLAVWRELDEHGNLSGHWEAPSGGPPAPGAVDAAYGFLRVATTLESLVDPLDRFQQATEAGLSPMEFLLTVMSEQGN